MGKVYNGLQSGSGAVLRSIPMLITYGGRDVTGKVKEYSDNWAKTEKQPLKVIPMAAHNANMDNPEAVNALLQEFLNEVAENRQD